ncbi:MAG: hypothetical protein IKB23_06060 [Clostridia bacterium]|nr:hypothetical protein [Clostridia bacterium]MBR3715915.1 hypothetical protein [Clostridia bacterium]
MADARREVGSIIDSVIYKNDILKRIVSDDIACGRFVHSSIIEGPPKSGKLTLARAIAAELSGNESAADKIMRGICADVYEIAPKSGRKTIGIEAIREIRATAFIVPNDSDIKAYIIRYADTMTVQAQNAILKLLEEPPKNVYFMLLVENAASLLATVRSRAPILRMQVFTSEEIEQYLIANSTRALEMSRKSPDELSHIVARSGGSIGEALRIIDEGDMSQTLAKQAVELLTILTDKDRASLAVFPFPSKNREELSEFLSLVRTAIRDMTASRSMAKCEMLFGDDAKMTELSKKVGMTTLLKAEMTVSELLAKLERNLAIANIKAEMVILLWRAFAE